ncbi:single-stranded DNA-binding protein [Microbacterium sp. CH12i]|uniref:single-stranded DNA-binding protein n=1 Tax=Microbacterium sp. CH12i TaxID=1479651 RepID=UPI000460EE6B|nr:single-stranded DNA-binding protein [Microbacterium sp. CH12i]KDA05525.1 single-stranded DNA-binding protein [Microbacterium sp. CH12i]
MNDTVTILGRVGADPNRSETTSGVPVVNFRVASPQRRYDSKTQSWIETGTNWYNISAFRQLADHAKASLRQGDGVIITGRLKVREWETAGRKGVSVDVEAEAIGHDLRWGASAFMKANRLAPSQQAAHDPDGVDTPPAADADTPQADHELESNDEAEEGEESSMALSGSGWGSTD